MQQSEGFIEVFSLVDVGTEFRLFFPIQCASGVEGINDNEHKDLSAFGGSERILVVDDESQLRRTTAALLEQAGYQVSTIGIPKQAVAMVRDEDFDFVLSDVVMPDMDGYELAEALHEHDQNISIQLMSGYLSEPIKQKIDDKGLDILQKPFSHRELLRFVRSSIDKDQ
jgi:DNA-binding NtrC family response regulator